MRKYTDNNETSYYDPYGEKARRARRRKDAAHHKPTQYMPEDTEMQCLDEDETIITDESETKSPVCVDEEVLMANPFAQTLVSKLQRHGITPNSDIFNQHFLIDPQVIAKIVEASEITADDNILEIGPGPGNLTEAIWDTCRAVRASLATVELDNRFRNVLAELQSSKDINMVWGDAIALFGQLVETHGINKVIANIPYKILEPLLIAIHTHRRIKMAVLMVGKRYTDRVTADLKTPSQREEGFTKTSLFSQARFTPRIVASVPRESFLPQPRTESAIVVLQECDKKEQNPILRKVADMIIRNPNYLVRYFLKTMIDEIFNTKTRRIHVRDIDATSFPPPDITSLGLQNDILNAPIGRLPNHVLRIICEKLDLLRKKAKHHKL